MPTPAAPRRRPPSMADVARLAGVSGQTVSRVANGASNVEEPTRLRVLAAMRTIGYRPNSAARALRVGRFNTIGVIAFNLSTLGNVRTLDAVATHAARAGYAVSLQPLEMQTHDAVTGAFSRLGQEAVDGVVILIEAHLFDQSHIELPPGLPTVVIDSDADDRYMVVDSDQAAGARAATDHLLSLGHRTVWHLGGPTESFAASRRIDAWRARLEEAGAAIPTVRTGDWTADSGHRLGRDILTDNNVSAIFAANDQMALGVLRACHELGLRVPDDVSVVGFDDMEEAASFWPPLTTVRQDFTEVGRRCINSLVDEITTGNRPAGKSVVPTELIVRSSTGPPRHA